ncbi:MAG: CAP domain-containing protein [Acutalibacteraceae bacterium]|nr:CAP domain-containing protein [Acutalibacteraceae bacterium]
MKNWKKLVAILCAATLLAAMFAVPASALTRTSNRLVPKPGNTFIAVPGEFRTDEIAAAVAEINAWRKEACNLHYRFTLNGNKYHLKPTDYRPIHWSGELEMIAQTRAAEEALQSESVGIDHNRPDGSPCWDAVYDKDVPSMGENCAGDFGLLAGLKTWEGEKQYLDPITGKTTGNIGHWACLLIPSNNYVGIGTFRTLNKKGSACVLELLGHVAGKGKKPTSVPMGMGGVVTQLIEVPIIDAPKYIAENSGAAMATDAMIKAAKMAADNNG